MEEEKRIRRDIKGEKRADVDRRYKHAKLRIKRDIKVMKTVKVKRRWKHAERKERRSHVKEIKIRNG